MRLQLGHTQNLGAVAEGVASPVFRNHPLFLEITPGRGVASLENQRYRNICYCSTLP